MLVGVKKNNKPNMRLSDGLFKYSRIFKIRSENLQKSYNRALVDKIMKNFTSVSPCVFFFLNKN